MNEKSLRGAQEGAFDVGGRISFGMLVRAGERDEKVELREDIVLHTGVGVFVYGYRRCCMRNKENHQTISYFTLLGEFGQPVGDIQKFRPTPTANGEFMITHNALLIHDGYKFGDRQHCRAATLQHFILDILAHFKHSGHFSYDSTFFACFCPMGPGRNGEVHLG